MMHTQTIRTAPLGYRPSKLALFDDPTKRIDLFQLETHLQHSRRTEPMPALVDDFDTRETLPHRAIRPPLRRVYPTKRDPLPLFYIFVLLSVCCAVASLIAYG